MPASSFLSVDTLQLRQNLELLSRSCSSLMVMVKGNGYGSGAVELAQWLQEQTTLPLPFLGVSHIYEAVALREAGIEMPLFVISAPPHTAHLVQQYQLTPSINSAEEMRALEALKTPLSVHLAVDTGMNRFGVPLEDALLFYHEIQASPFLRLEGIHTHFMGAEEKQFDPFTHGQIKRFSAFLSSLPTLPRWIHAANSAGLTRFEIPACNLARVGLVIWGYGSHPRGVKPVLKLSTTLSNVRFCKQGESVGYNQSFTMQQERGRIGIIPIGYGDGLSRSLTKEGYVLIGGKKAPMIGVMCMDFTFLDLSEIPEAKVGDEVILFGEGLSPEKLALWNQTDVRDVLVKLTPRIKRVWTQKSEAHIDDTSERISNPLCPL